MVENSQLFKFYHRIGNLDQRGKIVAEYIWLDGTGITIRSKSKTITKHIGSLEDLPGWNYDGSSTY